MFKLNAELMEDGHLIIKSTGNKTNPIEVCCVLEQILKKVANGFSMPLEVLMDLLNYVMKQKDEEGNEDDESAD